MLKRRDEDLNKKVAVINDMSGIGKCSLTVAIPILSCLNVQPCPFPTALLSSQTGYPYFSFLDFTDEMINYKEAWNKLNVKFDAIYTGFLGSERQIDIVSEFILEHKESLIIVDPVMGDHGSMYKTYTEGMCNKIKHLVQNAYIVTPNATESCILTGKDYESNKNNLQFFKERAIEISNMGPEKVVITGIVNDDMIYNLAYNKKNNEFFTVSCDYNHKSFSGTGDMFTSILCGMLLNDYDMKLSVEKATNFIHKAIDYTGLFETNPNDGVMFEKFLGELIL